MGFNTDNLSLYHTFSKTPVDSNTSSAAAQLGNAINKSGHTVQSNEIWTESIPFFGLAATTTAIHNKFSATAKVNDLVKDSDGKIWQRNSTAYTEGAAFANLWSEKTKSITSFTKGADGKYIFTEADGALVDGSYLLNSEGIPTVKYYEKRLLTRLTADNNANTNSDNKASRLQIDGKWIDQFIGVTDIYLNGSAAVSYAPVLRKTASSSPMQAGPGKGYMDYCATGLILWESSAAGTEVIDCFEYVGAKLDATVAKLSAAVFGSGSTGDEDLSLSEQVTANTTAINVLKGADTVEGSIANSIKTAIDNLGDVAVKSDITITGIQVKVGSGTAQALTPTNKVVTIEIPEVQAAAVQGGVITTDGFAKASDAKAIAEKAIETSLAATTTEGSIGKAIADVEGIINGVSQTVTDIQTDLASGATAQAIAAAKKAGDDAMEEAGKKVASVTGPTTGLVTVSGDKDVTITVSDTIATKSYADTAATNAVTTGLATGGNIAQAIATAKSGAEQTAATALSTARGEITTEIGTAVSGLETKLTTGEGSLGAKVAALETATGTTLPAAIEQSLTDAKKYTDDEIDKVEKSISDALATHTEDIAKVEAAISSLSTSGFERIIVSELPTTDIKLNAIYLVPMTTAEKELNGYAEYIYVGGTVTEGVVSGGKFEQIGTTKTDLTEYAKSVTVNGTKTPVTASTGDINIGKVASSVADGTVTGSISDAGVLTLTIDDATTSQKGAVQLDNTIADSTSETTAATPKAVKEYAQKALTVKDGRETVTENDVWGTTATLDSDGVLTVEHNWLTRGDFTKTLATPGGPTTKVIDNKVYHNDEFYCNVQTDRMTNMSNEGHGGNIFGYSNTLVEFSSDLSNLTNGYGMFCHEALSSFSADMPSLRYGKQMFFDCPNLVTFENDLHSLKDATYMFGECSGLESFTSDLPSLENGMHMFKQCSKLESFSSDLSNLTSGYEMFSNCSTLKSFASDLSKLTNGYRMFYGCFALDLFCGGDMSSLTEAEAMFSNDVKLTSFASDLSSLTYGACMFDSCSKLTSFTSDLSSLTNGTYMFSGCALDTESVEIIADTINDVTELEPSAKVSKRIDIWIGNTTPNDEEDAAFKQMQDKGWSIYVNSYNTEYVPTTGEASLDETGETTVAPKPYWAKPIEVTEEEAEFVGEDGKFYQVVGGQFIYVNDPDTYGMFVSREDAIANMRLTKYVKPVEEETEAQA